MTAPTDPIAPFRAAASQEHREALTEDEIAAIEKQASDAKKWLLEIRSSADYAVHPILEEGRLGALADDEVEEMAGGVAKLAAEVRRLMEREERLTHKHNGLGEAIADAALKAGIYNGEVSLTGPELVLLTQNMADDLVRAAPLLAEQCRRQMLGEMAVADVVDGVAGGEAGVKKSAFQEVVSEFHRALDFPVRDVPTVPGDDEVRLRARLILEETFEVLDAMFPGIQWTRLSEMLRPVIDHAKIRVSLPSLAHELADLHYVTSGTSAQFGINEGPVFATVNAANMAKVGGGKDERGKAMKPAGWKPADVAAVLRAQGWPGDAEVE